MANEHYQGHEIEYSEADDAEQAEGDETPGPSLTIDQQDYDVVVHSDGTYSAREYYYDKFGSLPALGRAIASRLPE